MLRQRPVYFLIVLVFITAGLVLMLFWDKGDAVLRLNGMQSVALDEYFRWVTLLGEWFGGVLVGLLLLLLKPYRYLFTFMIAIGFSSGTAQLLKTQVFSNESRPSVLLEEEVRQVEGVQLHKRYSFPSGHTTGAFCAFTFLALSFRTRRVQFLAALLACSVGVSRMVLGQHFLVDVVAGAVLGTVIAAMVYRALIDRWGEGWAQGRLL